MSRKNPSTDSKFAWLKDSEGVWNYSRITGFVMLMFFQPCILLYILLRDFIPDINNLYQWLIFCIPSIVAVILFFIDFFRDKNSLKIHFGNVGVEYSDSDKDDEDTEVSDE